MSPLIRGAIGGGGGGLCSSQHSSPSSPSMRNMVLQPGCWHRRWTPIGTGGPLNGMALVSSQRRPVCQSGNDGERTAHSWISRRLHGPLASGLPTSELLDHIGPEPDEGKSARDFLLMDYNHVLVPRLGAIWPLDQLPGASWRRME